MKSLLYSFLINRKVLWMIFLVNVGGTIYGYDWYKYQLADTRAIFIPFVPDSPTASLFFVFVLMAFLLRTNWPYLEALALITLVKYGVWAVVMNMLTLQTFGHLSWQGYMLIASHAAMAIQGLLYAPFYKMKLRHVLIAAIWTLHNDVIDYVYMQYPVYPGLDIYIKEIGYFTFWLSMICIGIGLYFVQQHRIENSLSLPYQISK